VGRAEPEVAVGFLPQGEELAAVHLLADAFADNPLNRAVIRSPRRDRRERSNAWGLRIQLPLAARHGQVLAGREGGRLAGVLVGGAPWAHPFPAPSLLLRVASAFGQGLGAAARWGEAFEALLARRPADAHWYLSLLGVRPERRGRGIGAALLASWLGRVDEARGAAWLETDEPRTLALYRRAGFEVRGELELFSVPIWLLGREPRA
jgi:ribosomal protein S18 acetylase RimI-like enzyme